MQVPLATIDEYCVPFVKKKNKKKNNNNKSFWTRFLRQQKHESFIYCTALKNLTLRFIPDNNHAFYMTKNISVTKDSMYCQIYITKFTLYITVKCATQEIYL